MMINLWSQRVGLIFCDSTSEADLLVMDFDHRTTTVTHSNFSRTETSWPQILVNRRNPNDTGCLLLHRSSAGRKYGLLWTDKRVWVTSSRPSGRRVWVLEGKSEGLDDASQWMLSWNFSESVHIGSILSLGIGLSQNCINKIAWCTTAGSETMCHCTSPRFKEVSQWERKTYESSMESWSSIPTFDYRRVSFVLRQQTYSPKLMGQAETGYSLLLFGNQPWGFPSTHGA